MLPEKSLPKDKRAFGRGSNRAREPPVERYSFSWDSFAREFETRWFFVQPSYLVDSWTPMPANSDLAAAASSIFNASRIITSSQVTGRVPNVDEDNIRILFTGLFEAVQHQNEALESLRAAIEKLARKIEPDRDTLAR